MKFVYAVGLLEQRLFDLSKFCSLLLWINFYLRSQIQLFEIESFLRDYKEVSMILIRG